MGLETSPTRANFDARSLVTPRDPAPTSLAASELLSNAFAKGLITTDDILKRVGPRAHKQAQVESKALSAQEAALDDPMKAMGRAALAEQQKQLLGKAIQVGAPIPQDEHGDVDFKQLFQMAPQFAEYDRRENQRVQQANELQDAFKRAASKSPTDDRNVYVSWKGNTPLAPEDFAAERARLSQPTVFSDLFQHPGTPSTPGGVVTPTGEIVGSGTPIQPTNAPSAAPATTPLATPNAPASTAPASTAPTSVAPAGSFFPTRQGGPVAGQKTLTEVQTKAFMAGARFDQLEPVLEALEDSDYNLTGKWDTMRRWIAEKVPDWAPWIGHAALPGEAQLYESASKGWAQGLLRLESGAAISVKEESSYIETFMPRAGDSEATVEMKRGMRHTMADAIQKVAQGVHQAEASGNTAFANELRTEYTAARDNMIDYVGQQSTILNEGAMSDVIAKGIRHGGGAPTGNDFSGTAVAKQPGFAGIDAATGLPAFQRSAPVVSNAGARPDTVGFVEPKNRGRSPVVEAK